MGGDDCVVEAAGSANSIRGSATLSAWKSTYLFVLSSLRFSLVIGTKVKSEDHIHAMFAARRCASAKVDSRDPMVDSVLIAGHVGTAAAARGSARESALRCCALPWEKRGSKLAAGADAELGEDLPQVVGDGGGADE
jgi:hypothetical protein